MATLATQFGPAPVIAAHNDDAYALFPAELKPLRRWVLWRVGFRDKIQDGKPVKFPTKVPYTIAGFRAKTSDSTTWSTYEHARDAIADIGADGLGFVFATDDGNFGVDLDHVRNPETGKVAPWALDVIKRFNSYTELSPSRTGFHIFARGNKPPGSRSNMRDAGKTGNEQGFEFYAFGRYFTVTGEHFAGTPLEIRTVPDDELAAVYAAMQARFLDGKAESTTNGNAARQNGLAVNLRLADDKLLRKMFGAKNGDAIARLYHGEWGAVYGSQSEADIALCGHLAFWTGKDRAQIDRLFRASGLMREKWDTPRGESTYGENTTGIACDNCSTSYSGNVTPINAKRAASDTGGADTDAGAANDLGEWLDYQTEQRAAELFCRLYGDQIRYAQDTKTFYFWNGRYWITDSSGAHAGLLMQECVKRFTQMALGTQDVAERVKRFKYALNCENAKKQREILTLARLQSPIVTNLEAFDSHKFLFNVQNGTIDLRTGELRDHRPEDMLTLISPQVYDPAARCERFERFMREIFITKTERKPDGDLIAFVQRAVGYSLTGDPSDDVVFFLHGNGSNGKSTFIKILGNLFGGYGTAASPESFIERKQGAATNDLARLYKKRLVTSMEVGSDKHLSEAVVKSVTGGDKMLARFLYKEYIEFDPEFTLWFGVNHVPIVRDTDEGIWGRLRLVPFNAYFPRGTPFCDTKLSDELEAEGEGILAWAIRGCRSYFKDGLGQASAVDEATKGYRSDMDTFQAFLDERCIFAEKLRTTKANLAKAYAAWAADNSEGALSPHAITKRLVEKGFTEHRSGGRRGFSGIGIRNPQADTQGGLF